MIKLWQGTVNAWDCDEMGHMNVRVYAEKVMEGLGVLAHAIDMPHAYQPSMPSTLLPADQHIRFLREARPGQPLSMQGCVLEHGETDAVIYQEIQHVDGTPAAAFRTRLMHVETKSGLPFPWSTRSRERLQELLDETSEATAPRSIDAAGSILPDNKVSADIARAAGVQQIGLGSIPPQHCDLHGRMQGQWFIGRVSDSVPNLLRGWRKKVAASRANADMGGAVLEYRLIYRRWARAGDLFEVRSGLARVEEKFHTLVHWMLDPATGKAWMTSEALAVTFDLKTRKIIPTPSGEMKQLESIAPKGLAI